MGKMIRFTMLGLIILIWVQQPLLANPLIWHNGEYSDGSGARNISAGVAADDFILTSSSTLTDFRMWGGFFNETGSEIFSGTIGWAIYSDNAGMPGDQLYSGQDAAPVTTWIISDERFQLDASFGGNGIDLEPSAYWLALHEGEWGSPNDRTPVFWRTSTTLDIGYNFRADLDEINPTMWDATANKDLVFQLFGESDSAITIPEPSSLMLLGLGLLSMVRRKTKVVA